jgi:carnitine 3-dehydrogenase
MSRPQPADVRQVTCIGGGVIGAGWAAHFLGRGFDVVVYDLNPAAEGQMNRIIDAAWPSLERMGLAKGASRARVRFTTDLNDAVKDADFVQESAPERIDLKQDL